MAQTWFWIAVAAMALGSAAFLWMGSSAPTEDRPAHMNSFFITLIAGTMYLVLALNQGNVVVEGDRTVYYARYVTWAVTTPLLLLALAAAGLGRRLREHVPLVAGLLGADVYMIATGALSELSGSPNKVIWFLVSSAAFAAVLVLIWGPLRRAVAEGGEGGRQGLWLQLAVILSALWIGYPLVWLAGPVGTGAIDPVTQNALFVTLDILAKVGWGFLHLLGLRALTGQRTEQPTARTRARV